MNYLPIFAAAAKAAAVRAHAVIAVNNAGAPPRPSSHPSEADPSVRPRFRIAMNTANCVAAIAGVHSRIENEPAVTVRSTCSAVKT